VIIYVGCSCGHHPLVCDKCLAHFVVDCGDPLGPLKLPPEHAITAEPELDEGRKEAMKEDPPVTDEEFREAVQDLPTIEECKEYYAELEANPDAYDDEEDDADDNGPN
jgi:hypothetical protein